MAQVHAIVIISSDLTCSLDISRGGPPDVNGPWAWDPSKLALGPLELVWPRWTCCHGSLAEANGILNRAEIKRHQSDYFPDLLKLDWHSPSATVVRTRTHPRHQYSTHRRPFFRSTISASKSPAKRSPDPPNLTRENPVQANGTSICFGLDQV